MRIDKIFIKNFRAIGEPGLELTFANNCTTFIGENNVGKSSILEAIKRLLQPQVAWDKEDWHASDQTKTVEIKLECTLDDAQIKKIITLLELPLTPTAFKKEFTGTLTVGFIKKLGLSYATFKLGDLCLENNCGWIGVLDAKAEYTTVPWRDLILNVKHNEHKSLLLEFKEALAKLARGRMAKLYFESHVLENISSLLVKQIIVIEEFREKPNKSLVELWASPKGQELASVLFNLKNARPEQKKKFEQIQAKFHKMFPALELNVIRESSEIKIHIQKAGVESTTFYLGAGIIESLLLITHLIAHDDKVLCVDSPELHLHPHTQRRLGSFIEESKDSQILVITHSPYFVSLKKGNGIQRVIQKKAQTEIIEPPKNYFEDDYSRLEQFADVDAKELFFARKAVLVEGPTEIGTLPIFASKLGYNLDENGVSLINAGGVGNFGIFVKLCEGFKIPYLVIADNDARNLIANLGTKYPNFNFHILPGKFDDLLPIKLRRDAIAIFGEHKPRVGRYVATKMLKEHSKVPARIKKIIEKVKKL